MDKGKVVAVVGGQFGSEAKGVVAYELADQFGVSIRTGGPNAGHTFYHHGRKFVARSIPCGWVNPEAIVVIGPGAVIDFQVFRQEYQELLDAGYDIGHRLYIDENAGIVTSEQHHGEGGVNGYAHLAIGSTGEGVGLCRMARINRRSLMHDTRLDFERVAHPAWVREFKELSPAITITDTVRLVNDKIDQGVNVLLEGTQGSGLSLVHGPWPFATSADTNAGQLAVDAGISPSLVTETILVCRTFPIRVAGNSGPLPNETSFAEIGQKEERTTVTKKVRRVARWDSETVRKSVLLNRPAKIALTFVNYLYEEDEYIDRWDELSSGTRQFIDMVERETGVSVVAAGTSPVDLVVRPGELTYGRI